MLARRHAEADAAAVGTPRRIASFTTAGLLALWDHADTPRLRAALSTITANPIAVAPGRAAGGTVAVERAHMCRTRMARR